MFKNKKTLLLICLAIFILIAGYLIYTRVFHKEVTTRPSTTQKEDIKQAESGKSPKNPNSQQSGKNNNQGGAESSNTPLATPQGNFVSSHTVNSLDATIESICTTTVGSNCDISFNNGSVSKSLGIKSVNSNGSASWIWTPRNLGLSSGTWTIVATASKNTNTLQAKDPLNLVIK